jgi:hypothetical protein
VEFSPGLVPAMVGSDLGHLFGLKTLGALHQLELDNLTLIQGAVAIALNGSKVYENILVTFWISGDKAKTLGVVEPLYSAG